jgi:protocatechuate 3,4-dioxygenase alpha subunit
VTRIYLSDETEANAADPVLASVDSGRRQTLIATAEGSDAAGPAAAAFSFDIWLQGEHETVFFDV